MFSAATSRFSRKSAAGPPSASLSPETRQERRLSRISPSEFDSILTSGETVKLASVELALAGDASDLAPASSAPSSPDPSTRSTARAGAAVPPGLSPEPRGHKVVRRARSLLGTVAEARSPVQFGPALNLASRNREGQVEAVDAAQANERDGVTARVSSHGAGSPGSVFVLPTSPSRRRSPAGRDSQLSVPRTSVADESTGSIRPPGRAEVPRLSSIGSYVHVPFPPVENRPESSQADASASLGFDFSPLRKGTQSGETGDGKMSLTGTMRKTSRFFRKLGGSSTTTTAQKATSVPSTPSTDTFRLPVPPPVPTIPLTHSFTSPSRQSPAPSRHSASPARYSPAPRDPRVNRRDLPRLPPASHIRSPGESASASMARDDSNQSFLSDASRTSAESGLRRRSLSLNSLKPEVREAAGAGSAVESSSLARRPSNRTEDDQLRRELRRWRLGVDGVLGSAGNGSVTPSSSLGASSSIASHSSPHLNQDLPNANAPPPGSPLLEKRRASVPATMNDLPPIAVQRTASLPTSSLLPIPSVGSSSRQSSFSEGGSDTPEIRLIPSSRNGSVSSAVTVGPSSASLARSSATRQSASSSTSTENGTGVGVGLATITEAAAHSRESSLGPVTPTRESFTAAATTPKPLPRQPDFAGLTAEPSSASSTTSTRSKGARGSIVALQPLTARLNSSLSSSTVSSTSWSSRTVGKTGGWKAAEAAADEALSEEELQEKARGLAERAWEEDETFIERRKIAEWIGSSGRTNTAALRLYIDHFNFTGLKLDAAFRRLCRKLYLKAETQQVDRILEQFSRRYFEDNPQTVYGSSDVVHAVSYSLLLLNTDLHVVDTTTRMTRQQFIRNTLEAIHAQTGDSEVLSPAQLADGPRDSSSSVFRSAEATSSRRSLDSSVTAGKVKPASVRSLTAGTADSAASLHVASSPGITRTEPDGRSDNPARLPSATTGKLDEAHLQAALKDMYNAIKAQPIYQISSGSGSSSALHLPQDPLTRSSSSFAPSNSPYNTWGSNVSRATSRRSATSTMSGTPSGSNAAYKRSSMRGMGAFLGASSSLDLVRSTSLSPSTATSLSDERWNTAYGPASQHHAVPTIGFANSLSNTIIREQQEDDAQSEASEVEITDEELALLGAPWAKEGMLWRKHYWESPGSRAKDKHWAQAFVVVSQGELKMFRFDGGGGGGSSRGMGGVGGGDWTSSASNVGSISLIHALCSAMPPPGYNSDRPHCFILTLPTGGSYFFQAGTPDLVTEWVSTCNYWSARLSKEPLSGGVSNMEYGWNRVEAASSPDGDADEREEIASIRSSHSRRSYASSAFRNSAHGAGADRIHVNEWKPPQVPLVPSNLSEEVQLEALKRHAAILQRELAQHNTLHEPMKRLYPARSAAGTKAFANWERKSRHLVADSDKYRTYVDALASAVQLRALQRGQKEVARMLESADADADAAADDLVVGLSPYETGPPLSARQGLLEPAGSRRASTVDSTSAASVWTSTTINDEFFDSTADTPPPF